MMKISVSSYSFSQCFGDKRLTQFSCIAKAKEMGFDAIEFCEIIPHDGSTREEYAVKLGEEAKRLSLPVSNYTFGADFINGSNGDTQKEVDRVKKEIDIAVLVGATSVRHDATSGFEQSKRKYRGFDAALEIIAPACRAVSEYAATKGVKTMVENHGFFCQDSDRVEKLVNAVACENFGTLADMGNFLCVDENPASAFSRVAPYVFYAHAKDFIVKSAMEPNPGDGFFRSRSGNYLRGTVVGHGNVPVKQCLTILKNALYDGYIAIEFEGVEDAIVGLGIGLANLRRYIAEVSNNA